MRWQFALVLAALLVSACGGPGEDTRVAPEPAARIVLAGDVMLGRGVAGVVDVDPAAVFAGVRHLFAAADVVAVNLESPLTGRPHLVGEHALEAAPESARLLHTAGIDVASLANNHAGDAGPDGLRDTMAALEAVGVVGLGAGEDGPNAAAPVVVEARGVSVGFLAFDATGAGPSAAGSPGVATWDESRGPAAVRALRGEVDVVIASLHGGTEYLPETDPGMRRIAEELLAAGADVVWGHGAHVIQPVAVIEGGRPAVVATSLGNLLFDQAGEERHTGLLLEVLAGGDGVRAFRTGVVAHPRRTVEFRDWEVPSGDAAWIDGGWWSWLDSNGATSPALEDVPEFRHGDVVAAASGDVTADGVEDLVVSFRRPYAPTPLSELRPEADWQDALGRSAHLGVFRIPTMEPVWVAGTVRDPVASLAVCDGALATAHDTLDASAVVATGAWEWTGFGFETAALLPGPGEPACVDVDGDGATDPVIIGRR